MPPLLKLILIRIGLGLLTLLLVSIVVFAATQALPGDPAQAILGREAADKARYEALRRQLNLDEPLINQYSGWLGGVVRGDMGTSIVQSGIPVTTLLRERVINSATLVLIAALLSIPLSIVIGAFSAVWRDSKLDSSVNLLNLVLAALPEFVIGIALVLLFAITVFNWLPAVSRIDPGVPVSSSLSSSSCRRSRSPSQCSPT